jgi:TetR/AcrR family transcriptional regulator, regulator of cefoperazone and chloramphenicol sensitivity
MPAPLQADARTQLLHTALLLFAQKGFHATSTRELCQAAQANLSAIKYYFGDKAGLYREVLHWAFSQMADSFGVFDQESMALDQVLIQIVTPLLPQDNQSDQPLEMLLMRLYLFEMIQPSSILPDILLDTVAPVHQAFCRVLARYCGATEIDASIHQLAFAIGAMAHDYCMSHDWMQTLAPKVFEPADAQAQIAQRLLGYSHALIAYERQRRLCPQPTSHV